MSFVSGTRTIFCENTAPTGWTTVTSSTATLRIITSAGGTVVSGSPFGTIYPGLTANAIGFASNTTATLTPTTLTYPNGGGISHYHPASASGADPSSGEVDGNFVPAVPSAIVTTGIRHKPTSPFVYRFAQPPTTNTVRFSANTGTNAAHTHPVNFNRSVTGGSQINLEVKYITAIIAELN